MLHLTGTTAETERGFWMGPYESRERKSLRKGAENVPMDGWRRDTDGSRRLKLLPVYSQASRADARTQSCRTSTLLATYDISAANIPKQN